MARWSVDGWTDAWLVGWQEGWVGGCIPYGWLSMSICMCRLARPVLPFRRGRRRCRAMRRLLARLRRLLVTLSPKPPPRPHPHPHPSPSPSPSPPLLSSPSPPLTLTLTLITHLGHTLAPSPTHPPTLSIDPRPHSLMFPPSRLRCLCRGCGALYCARESSTKTRSFSSGCCSCLC